ncbi:MAG: MoaD/ThiS family protein [Anaerolineae bacterium]|nr:MoaD/ThiS family protein [Anaerolineae bacterium]
MGQVKVKVYAALGQVAGRTLVEALPEPISLADFLHPLAVRYGFADQLFEAPERLKRSYTVLVNGTSIYYLDGLHTVVRDGDEIVLMAFVTGG